MPPKANDSDENPSRLKHLFTRDKNKRAVPTEPTPSAPETPSGEGGSKFNTRKALHTTSKVLDAVKVASETSPLLGPLGIACDALKMVVDTAEVRTGSWYSVDVLIGLYHQGMVKNQDDLKELPAKLQRQLTDIQDKMGHLTDPRCPPSSKAIQKLVKSLEIYTTFVTFH
jgi:hypothetical protein